MALAPVLFDVDDAPGGDAVDAAATKVPDEAPSGFGSLATLCAVVMMLVAGIIGAGELHDNSFFTHLATGRWLTNGHFGELWNGTRDPYLFTTEGRRWVVQSWLASVVYDGADRLGGATAIRLVVAGTSVALMACLWQLSAIGKTLVARIAAVGAALAIGGTVWSERPLLFGLLFFALVLLAGDGSLSPRWLIPVGWAWVNMHGSFPLGVVALGVLGVGAWLDGRRSIAGVGAGRSLDFPVGSRWSRVRSLWSTMPEARAMGHLVVGIVAGGFLSPVGPVLLTFPVTLLQRREVLANVQEWKRTDFTQPWAQVFAVLVIVGLLGLLRRPSFRRGLLLAVFALSGVMAARNVAVASIAMVPVVAGGLEGIGSIVNVRSRITKAATAALLALMPVLILSTAATGDFRFDPYPVSSVDWLETRGLLDGSTVVIEQDYVGNYLELRYGGGVPVFMDDRYDLHPDELVEDYVVLLRGEEPWAEVLDRRGVEVVLWSAEEQLPDLMLASGDWVLGHDSDEPEFVGTTAPRSTIRYLVLCRPTVIACSG